MSVQVKSEKPTPLKGGSMSLLSKMANSAKDYKIKDPNKKEEHDEK
jgi:hypothetical protein